MSVTVKNIIPRKQAEAVQATQYTAPANTKCIIDKFTVTNTSASVVTINVNIVASADITGDKNLVLKTRSIAPSETYTCPELIGQVLEAGGYISTLAGAVTSLTISSSGREIV